REHRSPRHRERDAGERGVAAVPLAHRLDHDPCVDGDLPVAHSHEFHGYEHSSDNECLNDYGYVFDSLLGSGGDVNNQSSPGRSLPDAAGPIVRERGPVSEPPTDRRVRRTRELLRGAFRELIHEKGYDRITVQDILDRADVGRSTFYAHYRDKE